MADERRHDTRRVYRAGPRGGWRSRCSDCRWTSPEPHDEITTAQAEGRVHELYPSGVDWSIVEAWR